MPTRILFPTLLVIGFAVATPAGQTGPADFDLVIAGGRVIDPESGLDAVRHVGLRGDRIVAVSQTPLQGREMIEATGLVVSPGFIDIHRHAHGDRSYEFAARDGITSAFELEVGTPDVEAWYRMLGPARLINFGVSAGHIGARMLVLGDRGFMLPTGPGRGPATPAQVQEILGIVDAGLQAGGVAVGVGIAYTPGASAEELAGVFGLAAKHHTFVHAHLGGGPAGLQNALDLARGARVPLHVAHLNSTAGRAIGQALAAVTEARDQGLDVTTEVYPYTASATLIQSALFDSWESWPDERFGSLQWAATGERLTRETFAKYRAQGGSVISHSNTEENLRIGIVSPLPMIASDGGRDEEDRPTHPRATGTFARMLGHYVREAKLLSLPDAIRRMTIDPARRLEGRVPEMKHRGRIRPGAFADITVFDPARIGDRSTYENAAVPSDGIAYVLVNGVPVVRDGALADRGKLQGVSVMIGTPMPGRPIRAARR